MGYQGGKSVLAPPWAQWKPHIPPQSKSLGVSARVFLERLNGVGCPWAVALHTFVLVLFVLLILF